MKRIFSSSLIVAGLSLALLTPAMAGDSVAETIPPTSDGLNGKQEWFGPPYIQFARKNSNTDLPGYAVGNANYRHNFTTDFDSLPGDVSSDAFNLWLPFAGVNHDEFHLFGFINYGATKYDTSVPNLLTEDTLHNFYMPIVFIHDVSEKWIWGGMVMPSYSGAQSSSDNFAISAALGAGYNYSENLELFAGVYYYHGFGEEYIIPGAAFIWRPAPRWEAYLLPPIGGITYSVNDNWLVNLYGQYSSPTWHVKADDAGPDRDINVSSLRIGLRAEYNVHNQLWAWLGAGVSMGQELDIENTSDKTIQNSDIDMTPFVQVGLNYRF
ncbi:outer membrane beta-barrel protein [Verrucomicrobiaceae bacterium N1E253]|uniref:Outer membrane beta-barrel protein n=1 Tax=Oceaniferula marina TaxID=2748318 RepID=A0A851GNS3_9BACT|nr:DUF6268 family outer membrane beta-barrel protein [Oceaniferula marina]NWK55784.1 outer membrane beta-barrel protein [Oceaniferula marina]